GLGFRARAAWSATELGVVALLEDDAARARALLAGACATYAALGGAAETFPHRAVPPQVAPAHYHLGEAALRAGDAAQARARFAQSLAAFRRVEQRRFGPWVVEGLAALAAAEGQRSRAGRLSAAAARQRAAMGTVLPPSRRAFLARWLPPTEPT